MTWVLTDNSDTTLSLDDLTFFANRFYWRSNFHSNNLLSIKSIVYYIIYISWLQVVFSGISNFLEILFFKRVHTMFCSLFFFLCAVIASPYVTSIFLSIKTKKARQKSYRVSNQKAKRFWRYRKHSCRAFFILIVSYINEPCYPTHKLTKSPMISI